MNKYLHKSFNKIKTIAKQYLSLIVLSIPIFVLIIHIGIIAVFYFSTTVFKFLHFKAWIPNLFLMAFLVNGSLILWLLALLVLIIFLFLWLFKKKWKKAVLLLLGVIVNFIIGSIVIIFLSISGTTPVVLHSVKSSVRNKYFILATSPAPTDVCYQILSTPHLTWPLWTFEFDKELDYSEDGSLTENPSIILNSDENILVVKRGGEYTDALDLNKHKQLVEPISWTDEHKNEKWKERTNKIKDILKASK